MIIKYKLDSRTTVLLEPIDSSVSVSVGLWVKVGSRNENDDQQGYAHFIEHMLFKGTEKYSAKDIAGIVDRVGGQHNAATNREYTCYYINVVSDHLELAIKLLAEMYYNSLFDDAELEKEKNVIIEEIRMYEDTPDEYIHDLFIENMLSGHPLSHSILGTYESVGNLTREDLLGFYNDYYMNSNTVLVIAGKIDVDETRKLLDISFNQKIGNPSSPSNPVVLPPERISYKHIPRKLEQVHFCLGTEGMKRDDDDRWALYTLSTILGGSMSSRLFQNIREKEGLSYSIYSFHSSYSDNGVYGIYCATSPDKCRKAIELIIKECRDLIHEGITDDELRDAKAFMKGNLALSLESVEVRMGQLAKNEIAFQRNFTFDDLMEHINNVTRDDFERVCERVFVDKTFTIVSLGKMKGGSITSSDLSL